MSDTDFQNGFVVGMTLGAKFGGGAASGGGDGFLQTKPHEGLGGQINVYTTNIAYPE